MYLLKNVFVDSYDKTTDTVVRSANNSFDFSILILLLLHLSSCY